MKLLKTDKGWNISDTFNVQNTFKSTDWIIVMAYKLFKPTTMFRLVTLPGKIDCQKCKEQTCVNGNSCYFEGASMESLLKYR